MLIKNTVKSPVPHVGKRGGQVGTEIQVACANMTGVQCQSVEDAG